MNNPVQHQPGTQDASPLNDFSQCHVAILAQLDQLADFAQQAAAAQRARQTAAGLLALFSHGVIEHHAQEETELFTATLRSALPDEVETVRSQTQQLTREHRQIESLWKRLEGPVGDVAKGKPAQVDAAVAAEIVRLYRAHALFEEQQFLPLCARILGRNGNHMAALGLALHMRHVPPPVAYI